MEIKPGTFEFLATNTNIPACKPNNGIFTFDYFKAPIFNELVTFSIDNLPTGINANLIQVEHLNNSGIATVNRNSAPTVNLDYTLWSY